MTVTNCSQKEPRSFVSIEIYCTVRCPRDYTHIMYVNVPEKFFERWTHNLNTSTIRTMKTAVALSLVLFPIILVQCFAVTLAQPDQQYVLVGVSGA